MEQLKKIIYDIGSNNGDDIPYYLMKADLVIAVEANPDLCNQIKTQFSKEITDGRLIVENVVMDISDGRDAVAFYIHNNNHVLSQFPVPAHINNFRQVFLPSKNIISLIKEHGAPYYIKIDIEHFDQYLLQAIFLEGIFPPYISAESHSIDIFSSLVNTKKYQKFKLVDGATVFQKYENASILTQDGEVTYSFPYHSAGPFGNDIDGPWLTQHQLYSALMTDGLGWKDIHASLID